MGPLHELEDHPGTAGRRWPDSGQPGWRWPDSDQPGWRWPDSDPPACRWPVLHAPPCQHHRSPALPGPCQLISFCGLHSVQVDQANRGSSGQAPQAGPARWSEDQAILASWLSGGKEVRHTISAQNSCAQITLTTLKGVLIGWQKKGQPEGRHCSPMLPIGSK